MNFLRKFDGTGRAPRQQQRDAMEWLAKGWEQSKIDVINAPVGSGKSAIARAIQLATGAPVITPSNVLVNQYHDDYPTVNILKGKAHYQCKMGLTCHEWQNTLEQKPCEGCPYSTCKRAALDSKPTFFNPISLYYTTRHEDWTPPDVIVVDEAHQLGSMISMLTGTRLRQSLYKFDDRCVNELFLVDFLKDAERKLRKVATQYQKAQDFKKVSEITREYESCAMTRRGLEENGQNYAIWMEKGLYRGKRETFLNIKPRKKRDCP
jgi:Rad3-related DNA helicase